MQPAPHRTGSETSISLKSCLEEGLQNNYSLRITHNEEQVSKNNATLGNAGYLPTLDFSAGYKGTVDNTRTKVRESGETIKENGVFDQTIDVGLNLNWTIFAASTFRPTTKSSRNWSYKAKQIPV